MAKSKIPFEMSLLVSDEAIIMDDNKFTSPDGTPALVKDINSIHECYEIGDEISIPLNYNVYNFKTRDGFQLGVIARTKSKDGREKDIKFFPNSLAKCIISVDENGKRLGKVQTCGEVSLWYKKQIFIDNAMKILAGKTIVVKEKKYYFVRDHTTNNLLSECIYTYVWKNKSIIQEQPDLVGIKPYEFYKMYLDVIDRYNKGLKEIQQKYIKSKCSLKKGDVIFVKKRFFDAEPFYMVVESLYLTGGIHDDNTYQNPSIRIEGHRVDKDGYKLSLWANRNSPVSEVCHIEEMIEKSDIRCKGYK